MAADEKDGYTKKRLMSYAVVPSWTVLPFTTVFKGTFWGSGNAWAATRQGPMGVVLSTYSR